MRTENINYFVKAVNEGSINKASELLYMNHQNLGKILKNIENEVGLQLLNRDNSGISLTEDGEYVYDQFLEILRCYAKIIDYSTAVRSSSKGKPFEMYIYATSSMFPRRLGICINRTCERFSDLQMRVQEVPTAVALDSVTYPDDAYAQILVPYDVQKSELESEGLKVLLERQVQLTLYTPVSKLSASLSGGIDISQLKSIPIALYSAYSLESNDLYIELKKYGDLNVKHHLNNIVTFYEVVQSGEYSTIGLLYRGQDVLTKDVVRDTVLDEDAFVQSPILYHGKPIMMRTVWVYKQSQQVSAAAEFLLRIL